MNLQVVKHQGAGHRRHSSQARHSNLPSSRANPIKYSGGISRLYPKSLSHQEPVQRSFRGQLEQQVDLRGETVRPSNFAS